MLSAQISLDSDDSSRFFIIISVLNGMFQRIPIKSQFSSYSSAFTVMIVSDGLSSVHAGRLKSSVARNINPSEVLN
jgi:hypothetical protein